MLIQWIGYMQKLNGGAHIASVIATSQDVPQQRALELFSRLPRFRRRRRNFLIGLPGPTLVLEYLENGTLTSLRERLKLWGQTIPNRLLWKWYLCLTRACVGLKFPLSLPFDSKPRLEEIPNGSVNPANILHGDMHGGNILIGTAGDFSEHDLVPPLKLIDFAFSEDDNMGDERNMLEIGWHMLDLIIGRAAPIGGATRKHNGIETWAGAIVPEYVENPYPHLDDDLRELVIRCLARNAIDRPNLTELLHICKNAVQNKTAASYGPDAMRETDEEIGHVLQQLIYGASPPFSDTLSEEYQFIDGSEAISQPQGKYSIL